MIYSIVLFIILISGSLFAATFFQKEFEKVLPVTCMGIAISLYLFGLFGILEIGFYFCFFVCALLCLVSIIYLVWKRAYKQFFSSFATPSFFIFAILFLALSLFNRNKLAYGWDEFSHWVDSVKAMWTLDDFVTNPKSYSAFRSYPPIMSLFQYFCQKLIGFLHLGNEFVEGKVYLAYQIFSLSFFFPFLNFKEKKTFKSIFGALILFAFPLLFYSTFYANVYIDPFVGILAGCGFGALFLAEEKDILNEVYIALTCFCLVLAKDVGLVFALFLSFTYAIVTLIKIEWKNPRKNSPVLSFVLSWMPLFMTVIAKFTWKIELASFDIASNGTAPEFLNYTKMFIFKEDVTYLQTVVENFKSAFFEKRIDIGITGIGFSYFHLTLFAFALIMLVNFAIQKSDISKREKTIKSLILWVVIAQVFVYVYSLGATYVSNFGEPEAVILASYSRYMNIVYLPTFLVILLYFMKTSDHFLKDEKAHFILLFAIIFALCPAHELKKFANADYKNEAAATRAAYQELVLDIKANCKENSHIYFISQENSGFDYWVTRYSVRPSLIDNGFAWSVGEGEFYPGDLWTIKRSAEELQQVLLNENYDYVAIYRTNEYFLENYASLFKNPEKIENNSVFRFDRETLLLERVDVK